MSLVKFALRYPYTFYVLAAMMVFLGISAIIITPKDIFPVINVPVVSVIWQYTGLTPQEMEQRVTTYTEYAYSANVSDLKTMESETLEGLSVERLYFQPNVNISQAIAQVDAASNAIRALLPSGVEPPIIVQYNASSVPVLQISLGQLTAAAGSPLKTDRLCLPGRHLCFLKAQALCVPQPLQRLSEQLIPEWRQIRSE